jgi:hypothetical protein
MYLRYSDPVNAISDFDESLYTERELKNITKEINGKWYRIDPDSGNIMYEIPHKNILNNENVVVDTEPNIRIFRKKNTSEEIIVTDDVNFFID